MFQAAAVSRLYRDAQGLLDGLLALEAAMAERFYGMESAIRCISLSAMSGEAMVMIGPPGTAKSRLIRAFCSLIGVLDHDPRDLVQASAKGVAEKDSKYFEYLLTQFTEPSELFGYFDLAKLIGSAPALERMTTGQMQDAEVVFLDEVFNASSAILNALLTFMNERKFHDRGKVYDAPMKMLFAATNHPPREEGLGAVYDRFLLRCRMENAPAGHEPLARLLNAAWTETHSHGVINRSKFRNIRPDIQNYQGLVERMTTDGILKIDPTHVVIAQLANLVASIRARDLSEMSNRRLVKFSGIILAQALLRSRAQGLDTATITPADLQVVLDYGLDRDDPGLAAKLHQDLLLA